MGAADGLDHRLAPAVGHVDVDEHDVGDPLGDELDGGSHLVGVPDHLDGIAELGAHAREEEVVVVDQEHPHLRPRSAARSDAALVLSLTTGSRPGHDQLDLGSLARRAADDRRPAMTGHPGPDGLGDALVDRSPPRRGRNPGPGRVRRPRPAQARPRRRATRPRRPTTSPRSPSPRDPLRAGHAAPSVSSQSPTVTDSTATRWLASTSPSITDTAWATVDTSRLNDPGDRPSNNQARNSRSWARASRVTSPWSPAARWMSARVWSTESCTVAAMLARSSLRTRSRRSTARSRARRNHHGPKTTRKPTMTTLAARTASSVAKVGWLDATQDAEADHDEEPHRPRHAPPWPAGCGARVTR